MPMPKDIGVIDLMLAVPGDDTSHFYEWIKPMLMDKESHEMFKMPAQYMFKDIPDTGKQDDYIAYTLDQMDKVRSIGCNAKCSGMTGKCFMPQGNCLPFGPSGIFNSTKCPTADAM